MTYAATLALSLAAMLSLPQDPPRDTTLCGRIVTPLYDGAPAAEVWVSDPAGAVLARTTADGEGFYLLRRLPAVTLRLHARGDGLAEASLEVPSHGRHRAVSLQLEDGRELTGTVLLSDGSPAAGADVIAFDVEELNPGSPRHWSQSLVTDDDGKWRLAAAPLRPLLLRAFVPGRPLAEVQVARGHHGELTVRIPEGRRTARQVHIDNLPVGQRVVLHNEPNGRNSRSDSLWPARMASVVVADDGNATMWSLPVGHDLRVEAPGHRSYPLMIMCQAGNTADRRFALSPIPAAIAAASTEVRGRIVDELGNPLGGQVLVGAIDDRRGPTCVSAPDGSFTLSVPVREKVLCRIGLLSADRQLGGPECELGNDGVSWRMVAADPDTTLRLDAAPAATLHCPVRTDDGTPLVTTAIELTWYGSAKGRPVTVHSATDRLGNLHLEGLLPGTYKLTALRDDGLRVGKRIHVDRGLEPTEVTLPLPEGGEITGVVRGADGRPVASAIFAMARLRNVGARGGAKARPGVAQVEPESVRFIACDRDGRFRVPHAAAGDWVLTSSQARFGVVQRAPELTIAVAADRTNEVTFEIGQ